MERAAVGLQRGQLSAVLGVVAAASAIWVFPLVLGSIGMVFGVVAAIRGERCGWWVFALAAIAMLIGLLLNLLPSDSFA